MSQRPSTRSSGGGVQVDGGPRAAVGVVAREHCIWILGAQLLDAVGVTFERERVPPGIGRLGIGLGRELAAQAEKRILLERHVRLPLRQERARLAASRATG